MEYKTGPARQHRVRDVAQRRVAVTHATRDGRVAARADRVRHGGRVGRERCGPYVDRAGARAAFGENRDVINSWLMRHGHLSEFPPSRRKLEWQAQDARSLWDTAMQLRPSGIRAKRMTYLPALVAINQTSIVGPRRRVITPHEAARLQGFPEWFDFNGQRDALTYKQLGNAVNVSVVRHVFTEFVKQLPLVVGNPLDSLFQLNVLR